MNFINAAANQMIQTFGSLGVKTHVQTEKMSYKPGEIVTGRVWIHSMVPIPMQTVTLKISGFESTRVVERKYVYDDEISGHRQKPRYASGDTTHQHAEARTGKWVDIPHSQQNQILDHNVIIANYAQIVPAGSYAIPFQFVLPEVPGCFIETGRNFKAQITYTISAICNQFGGVGAPMSCSQEFFVEEKLKHVITEQAVDNIAEITMCCCINKGTCTISAVAAKNAVFPGDCQNAICDIQNESSCDIKRIELSIKKDFQVQARGHRESYSKHVATVQHKGLPKGYRDTAEFAINIPIDLTPTTNSTLIQSNYRMKIKLVMSGASNVAVDMPLTVYPASQQVVTLQPPPSWGIDMNQVQVAQMVDVMPSAPQMQMM